MTDAMAKLTAEIDAHIRKTGNDPVKFTSDATAKEDDMVLSKRDLENLGIYLLNQDPDRYRRFVGVMTYYPVVDEFFLKIRQDMQIEETRKQLKESLKKKRKVLKHVPEEYSDKISKIVKTVDKNAPIAK